MRECGPWVWKNGRLVLKRRAKPLSTSQAFHAISDYMDPLKHPITGQVMDSKSKFRAVTKAHGCTEIGNETQVDRRKLDLPPLKVDIARAIEELS